MNYKEHLQILKQGIKAWHEWRKGNPFRKADLRGANLRGANLRGADLIEADLRGANLRGANLREVDLREADLSVADLRKADLTNANLQGAFLHMADLREANLSVADLSGADLSGADLSGADLTETKLYCSKFNINKLDEDQLKKVVLSSIKEFKTINMDNLNIDLLRGLVLLVSTLPENAFQDINHYTMLGNYTPIMNAKNKIKTLELTLTENIKLKDLQSLLIAFYKLNTEFASIPLHISIPLQIDESNTKSLDFVLNLKNQKGTRSGYQIHIR